MSTPWTVAELHLAVQAYAQMLKYEKDNTPYVKAEINRELQAKIQRSKGSIEMRFQNISAVLDKSGKAWLKGYVPLDNVGPTNEEKIWKLFQQLQNH